MEISYLVFIPGEVDIFFPLPQLTHSLQSTVMMLMRQILCSFQRGEIQQFYFTKTKIENRGYLPPLYVHVFRGERTDGETGDARTIYKNHERCTQKILDQLG